MAQLNPNLDDLRKEYKDISEYSARVAIIFLTVLFLVAISFTRASKRVQDQNIAADLCAIKQANALSYEAGKIDQSVRCEIQVSYIFGDPDDINPACASPGTSDANRNSIYVGDPIPGQQCLDYDKLKESCASQRSFEADLERRAADWFKVKAPIPGVDTTIDLRYWMALFPIGFCLGGLYLYVLRKKQLVLIAIASRRIKDLEPSQTSRLDHLYFERDSAYTSFPSTISHRLFALCYLFLPIYVVYETLNPGLQRGLDLPDALSLILPLLFYAIAYGVYIRLRFDEQVAKITEEPLRRSKIRSALATIRGLFEDVAQRVSPQVPLALGAMLVLLSLFGSVSRSANLNVRGYQFVLHPGQYPMPGMAFYGGPRLSWVVYLSAVVFSVLVLILVILPRLYRFLAQRVIRTLLLGLVGSVFVISMTAFSISRIDDAVGWDFEVYISIKAAALILTLGLWIWAVVSLHEDASERASRIWGGLLLAYLPFFGFAVMEVFGLFQSGWQSRPLKGAMAFFLGAFVLTLGLVHLEYRSRLKSNQ